MAPATAQQTQTLHLRRHLRAPAERIYKAFLDPDALARWLPPYGFTGRVTTMEAKVGEGYRMTFTNFSTGQRHSFGARYVELTPYTRIRHVDTFDDAGLEGEMEVTIDFEEGIAGTFVTITQSGIPPQIPMEFATMGWQESLEMLARLVEPDIPAEGDIPGSGEG